MKSHADFPAPYSVEIPLSECRHDRAGYRRTDEIWLQDVWDSDQSRVVVVHGGSFPLTRDGAAVDWNAPSEVPEGQRLFLGIDAGVPHFALLAERMDPSRRWSDLHACDVNLSPNDTGLIVHATALSKWHQSHRHCSQCAGRLVSIVGGHALRCAKCGRQEFPRTDPAVIMLVLDGDRALLGHQAGWPLGRYSTLAGFVDPGESLERAVVREVWEEVGVEVTDVTFFADQAWPFPHSLMVAFFARALTTEIRVDGTEIEHAQWLTRAELKAQCEAGTITLPGGVSLSRSLVEAWYGGTPPPSFQ